MNDEDHSLSPNQQPILTQRGLAASTETRMSSLCLLFVTVAGTTVAKAVWLVNRFFHYQPIGCMKVARNELTSI